MSEKWLNRIEFWLLCAIPFPALFLVWGTSWFVLGIVLYGIWYRPFVHIYRLRKLKVIEEAEAWKFFMPFYSHRYMRELWLD